MKRSSIILLLSLLTLAIGCKSEKNITTYETLYHEQPLVILVAPVQDNAPRNVVRTTQDQVLNDELTQAAHFLRHSCVKPLVEIGYSPVPMLSADVILQKENKTYRQLMLDDISSFSKNYGIDAVLLIAVHKWKEPEVNEIIVFVEYTLRSTKSGLELMHTWVRSRKMQPVDTKGEPIELAADNAFLKLTQLNKRLAHRCILMDNTSDFVLRNIPTAVSRWYHNRDKFVPAAPSFYGFTMNPDGSVERSEYNEDAFGNECFTN